MEPDDYNDYDRRSRLYYSAFEEYDSLKTTYLKFYTASDTLKRRGRILTYGSTVAGGILLYIIGSAVTSDDPTQGLSLVFLLSGVVAALSFLNAVDNPQRMSNVCYNSGQTLQRVFLEFHNLVTVRLPDPEEELNELEKEYDRLLERKHTVNETTPQLGNKWYHRAKERRRSWEPKPLHEVTGKDKEFVKKDDQDRNEGLKKRVRELCLSPIQSFVRWCGY